MTRDLFDADELPQTGREDLAPGAVLLRGFATAEAAALLTQIEAISTLAPFRHMVTRGGFSMSVAMTNCGTAGWVTDRKGYRYTALDPQSGQPWPAMPELFHALAQSAAAEAGYPDFSPDACLINRYRIGAKMALHQDKDEADFDQPIVSVSLGLPAIFQFGGRERDDPVMKYALRHADVVVWGGPSRLHYHGILALKAGKDPHAAPWRYNLTFRAAQTM